MNNIKQQFTETMHILSKDINVWNKRIEQLNYPRWVLSKDNVRALILFGGNFDLVEGVLYPEYLVDFETEQEAIAALEAMKASSHLFAVSDYVDFNTLSPMYMPVLQSEIDETQGWVETAINQIKFFRDVLGIPNIEGTQIVDIPEQQTDAVLEYGVLVTPNKEGKDPFTHVHWHDSFADAEDYINFVHFLMNEFYPNATYSVIARSKGE